MVRSTVSVVGLALVAGMASGDVTDFNSLQHGQIIQSSTFALSGMSMQATNFRLPGAMPMAFDTTFINTADPDLQGPPWAGGNLPVNTILGIVVIIPENLVDADGDGIVDSPDDEGRRPAGSLTFTFAQPIDRFGFDVVDIEGVVQERTSVDFLLGGSLVGSMHFEDLENPQSAFYDPTIVFGDNTINRIRPITADNFGALGFDRVVINLGGSGAFDNIVTGVIPAPASGALLAMGGLVAARRRR